MSNVIISIGATVVLKTHDMLPIDIDGQEDNQVINNCRKFSERYSFNLRLYKTRNGHRAIVTNQKFDIKKDFNLIKEYFELLQADLRYLIVACNNGELDYFHMRLVPKTIPFRTFDEKQIIEEFIRYQKDPNISVCRYIDSFGDGYILDKFKNNIAKHDYATKAFNKNSILV